MSREIGHQHYENMILYLEILQFFSLYCKTVHTVAQCVHFPICCWVWFYMLWLLNVLQWCMSGQHMSPYSRAVVKQSVGFTTQFLLHFAVSQSAFQTHPQRPCRLFFDMGSQNAAASFLNHFGKHLIILVTLHLVRFSPFLHWYCLHTCVEPRECINGTDPCKL